MQITDGWIDEAIGIYYPHKSMSRSGYKPSHVVLHGTAGGTSAEAIANYFKDNPVQASTHIIIGTDGKFVQGISMDLAAWGNCCLANPRYPFANINWNLPTISIEHCKPHDDNSDVLTEPQKQTSFRVVKLICEHYGIDKRAGDEHGGIISHADLDSVNRARCPGPYPWQELFTFLNGEGTMTISLSTPGVGNFFTGDDSRWHCKQTGFDVIGAILAFYRQFGGTGQCGLTHLGLPVSGELYPLPNFVVQRFERAMVAYDKGRVGDNPPGAGDCYLMHIEAFYDLPDRVAELQKLLDDALDGDIATLKQELQEAQTKLALASAGWKGVEVIVQQQEAGGVL